MPNEKGEIIMHISYRESFWDLLCGAPYHQRMIQTVQALESYISSLFSGHIMPDISVYCFSQGAAVFREGVNFTEEWKKTIKSPNNTQMRVVYDRGYNNVFNIVII